MCAFTCVSILSDFMSGIMHYDNLHVYLFYFIIIGGFNKDYYYYYYYYYNAMSTGVRENDLSVRRMDNAPFSNTCRNPGCAASMLARLKTYLTIHRA